MRMSAKNQGPLTNDTTFGFALSIVLALISSIWGTVSPFDPYLFWQKAAFQHFDETKKDGISHTAHFAKGACPNQCKRGLLQGRPCRLCIHHRDTFVYFYQATLPGLRLRMDKGIKIGRAQSELQSRFDLVCRLLLEKK